MDHSAIPAGVAVGERPEVAHDAFISYSRTDKAFASALERALEAYVLPKDAGRRRLRIFRDEEDFTGTEYYGALEQHLTSSNCLIVVCSPAARASRFVNEEIAAFASTQGADRIIPVIVAGIPDNEARAEDERERAFPDALLQCMRMPLAISYQHFNPARHRIQKGAYQAAWFSLLANIVGLSRDEIEQRERKRQARVRNYSIAALLGLTTVLSALSIWALAERNTAAVERDEAAKQRDVAAKERDEASRQRDEAGRQRDEASRQRDKATEQTALAEYQAGVARNESERARRALSANYLREGVARLDRGTVHEGLAFLGAAVRLDPSDLAAREAAVDALLRFSWELLSIRHDDTITDASFSPDDTRIVTASHDKTARVWDARTGAAVGAPMQHADAVVKAQFSRDGRWIVTASRDKTARVWDALTGQAVGASLQHEHAVDSARFSDDGLRVVTASRDQTARVWNARTGEPMGPPLRHDSQVNTAEFSRDGTRIVTAFVNGARVWNASTGEPVSPILRHAENVFSAAFSPDGTMVVTASRDGTAQVWDASSGQRIGEPLKHADWVTLAVFSPDGALVLTGSPDFTARVWDARTGRPRTRSLPHGDAVRSGAFDHDGTRVVTSSTDGMVRIWDVRTQQLIGAPLGDAPSSTVSARGFSADGTRVLTSANRTVRIWTAPTRQPVGVTLQHRMPVMNAVFTPDGKEIVTYDGWLETWDAVTGLRLGRPPWPVDAPGRVRFNADKTLALSTVKGIAQTWNVRTGQRVGSLMRHADTIIADELSRDGSRVVTGSIDKTAQVWDSRTGRPIGQRLGHADRVVSVGFSPDGRRVVTASGRTVRVRNTSSKQPDLLLEHPAAVNRALFSPDGQRIATVADAARLWHATTGRPIGSPMKMAALDNVVFSPDGRLLATVSGFRNAQLWDGLTAQPLGPPLQHSDVIFSVSFSRDGTRVATGSADGTARVWDVRTGQPVSAPLQHFGPVHDANFSPDGTLLITASGDGTSRLWHLPVTATTDGALIADVAEAASGFRVNETGSLSAVPDVAARLAALRAAAPGKGGQHNTAMTFLHWLFEDPWGRPIVPRSRLTASDYVSNRLRLCTPLAVREVAWHFPGHGLLHAAAKNCAPDAARDPGPSR